MTCNEGWNGNGKTNRMPASYICRKISWSLMGKKKTEVSQSINKYLHSGAHIICRSFDMLLLSSCVTFICSHSSVQGPYCRTTSKWSLICICSSLRPRFCMVTCLYGQSSVHWPARTGTRISTEACTYHWNAWQIKVSPDYSNGILNEQQIR